MPFRVCSISVPLVETSINRALRLDAAAARAASPLFWKPPAGKSLDAVVGENESAEYFRQSRTIVEVWGAAGVATRFGVGSRRQSFYRDRAARRSGLADGVAPEATGGALAFKKVPDRADLRHLRQITLSIKCFATIALPDGLEIGLQTFHPEHEGRRKCQVKSQELGPIGSR